MKTVPVSSLAFALDNFKMLEINHSEGSKVVAWSELTWADFLKT